MLYKNTGILLNFRIFLQYRYFSRQICATRIAPWGYAVRFASLKRTT